MIFRWPWIRRTDHHADLAASRRDLAAAQARLIADEAAYVHLSRDAKKARKKAGRALAAEQAEIRKNHLGELVHAALATPGRHHQ